MFARFLTHKEKDINSTSLGKQRNYCLKRGERLMRFTGTLLSFYRAADDCLEPAAQNQTHLETIALFRTQTQYLIYYILHYQNNEHLEGRHVYVHATPDLDAMARFIEAMTYVNKRSFAEAVVDDARKMDV